MAISRLESDNWLTFGREVATAYPRLSGSIAEKRVEEILGYEPGKSEEPLFVANAQRYGDGWVEDPYPMKGLEPVDPGYLWSVREFVLAELEEQSLDVGKLMSVSQRQEWDRVVGRALFEKLDFDIFEAFDEDVWAYLTVHLFWDFPQWRFPGRTFRRNESADFHESPSAPKRPSDRVLGGSRNVLFRTWFRVYVLGPDFAADGKVDFVGEDVLDNLFGRPSISQDHHLSESILRTLYRNEPREAPHRRPVFREFMKAILRRKATINFLATGDLLERELDKLWHQARNLVNDTMLEK